MGRSPMAFSFCCSHLGDSFMVTPAMLTPLYRLQAFLFSTDTAMGNELLSGLKLSGFGPEATGCGLIFFFS